jgi:hypothetical protein
VLNTLLTARSLFSVTRLNEIARNTYLVTRNSRKFCPGNFLLTLLKSVCSGKASFNQLAMSLGGSATSGMSKQALHKRFNKFAIAFLLQVISDLLTNHCSDALDEFSKSGFKRILVEDSTTLRLPKANAELFPAHGNSSGSTAGVKCDLCYDLLSQQPIAFDLHRATEQDRTIGKETLALARKDDLLLRDMGYFDLSEFSYLEGIGAFWFTRLPLTVNLVSTSGTSLEILLKNAQENQIDMEVLVGEVRHKCRLVAVRADKQTTEKRRRERHKKAQELGKTASSAALVRDGWHLMLTNLPPERISVAALAGLYRSRWAVEIQFRAWKQSLHIAGALNRKSNKWHIEALVCGSMIVALMGLKQLAIYARQVSLAILSPEKIMDWIADDISRSDDPEKLATDPPDLRYIRRDVRGRKSTVIEGIAALS